jgi:hypothetical protein
VLLAQAGWLAIMGLSAGSALAALAVYARQAN